MQFVVTPHAPAAIGPYSQAIVHGDMLYCSGQIGMDCDCNLVAGGLQAQCQQIFANIDAVLTQAKTHKQKIIKTTIFLTDMNDFAPVNELYSIYMDGHLPARSTIQVAGLPKGACVEIECMAYIG